MHVIPGIHYSTTLAPKYEFVTPVAVNKITGRTRLVKHAAPEYRQKIEKKNSLCNPHPDGHKCYLEQATTKTLQGGDVL